MLQKENIGIMKKYLFLNIKFQSLNRANIEERGICYRLYPRSIFNEKINENINSEMARQPLLVRKNNGCTK